MNVKVLDYLISKGFIETDVYSATGYRLLITLCFISE